MNTPNSEIKRWGIIVIQSLNHSDVKTGEIQYHDILQRVTRTGTLVHSLGSMNLSPMIFGNNTANPFMATKAFTEGYASFDDRSYVRFTI